MRRMSSYLVMVVLVAASCLVGKPILAADDKAKAPVEIVFDKVGKMAPVTFQHKSHGDRSGCPACHEGKEPLFAQKRSEAGFKMKDMKDGKLCAFCHDGVKTSPIDKDKKIFAVSKCMNCHKKVAAAK